MGPLRALHIAAGFVALAVFLVPMLTRKGGRTHVRAGRVFALAMAIVAVTGLVLSGAGLLGPRPRAMDAFLLFISVLAGATTWYGVRVLRQKQRTGRHRDPLDLAMAALLLASGAAMALYGHSRGSALLAWFPLLGVGLGGAQLAYWLRPPKGRMHWWPQHMTGMFSACIGTVTAFLVVGAPGLGLTGGSWVLWIAPSAVMVPILVVWIAYYQRRFA